MPSLIVFSHLRWSFVYQRPQQLMSRLAAQGWQVLYVEEPVHDDTAPAHLECRSPVANVQVLRPHTPVRSAGFHDDQLPVLMPLLTAHLRANGIDDPIAWLYTPMALPLLGALRPRAVVYDCVDAPAEMKNAARQTRQRENALLKRADIVFTGGPTLYEARRALNPNVHCLCSAVDAHHFTPTRLGADHPQALAAAQLHAGMARPRVGFYGVIDERVDLGLIAHLADARPQWQIVMAGPVVHVDAQALPQRPNIAWLGMQPYERLPYLMAQWDVCMIPFAVNDATRHLNPTKTLEYLAGEKPVVSTAVPDVDMLYGHVVRTTRDADGFVEACAAALSERGYARAERISEMLTTVSQFSWDNTACTVQEFLRREWAEEQPSPASAATPPDRYKATVRRIVEAASLRARRAHARQLEVRPLPDVATVGMAAAAAAG